MAIINRAFSTRRLALQSRLVLPPIASGKADGDGFVTDELIEYYVEKARGGCLGLLIVEHSFISQQGKAMKRQLSIADDGKTEGLSRLTKALHAYGCKVAAQLNHAGGATIAKVTGQPTVSPSMVPFLGRPGGDEILDEAGIRQIVEDFSKAAERAQAAGFDGVEIHSAHGYLLNQFCSPYTNRRTDAYGGSVENRLNIHRQVIRAVRQAVGPAYPVLLRLGACDYLDGGNTIDDAVAMAKILAETDLDILDVSGGLRGYIVPGREHEQGYFSDITQAIKQAISLPVILTGGITDIHAADALIAAGKADLIGVARAMIEDAGWAEKAFAQLEPPDAGTI